MFFVSFYKIHSVKWTSVGVILLYSLSYYSCTVNCFHIACEFLPM